MQEKLDWVDQTFGTRVTDGGYVLSDEFYAGLSAGGRKKLTKLLGQRGYDVQRVGTFGAVIQRVK